MEQLTGTNLESRKHAVDQMILIICKLCNIVVLYFHE